MTPAASNEFTDEFADMVNTGMSRRGVVRAGALALGLGAATLAGATTPALAAESSSGVPTADNTGVRPFRVDIPRKVLDDMRRRISATRWPDKETAADTSQGVPLVLMRDVAQYWGT